MQKLEDWTQALWDKKYKDHSSILCRKSMHKFLNSTIDLLFPVRSNYRFNNQSQLTSKIAEINICLEEILACCGVKSENIQNISAEFIHELQVIEKNLVEDAEFIKNQDPATKDTNEVVLCYPGFFAIATYRIAHFFDTKKISIFPRVLSEYAHSITGIDIHPGAKIGTPFFVDHGTGVVIGQTCIIGNHVKIFQGVTLGAHSVAKSMQDQKRHPTIEDSCIIYANTTILGGDTIVGANSIIGGNVWLTKSIAANSTLYNQNIQSAKS